MSANKRLESLHRYRILDTLPEQAFDGIVKVAAELCRAPIATLSFYDQSRMWFKAAHGSSVTEMDPDLSFCRHTIESGVTTVIGDAFKDDRFRDNPYVNTGTQLRFYAGVPLITPDNQIIGALAVLDIVPRDITPGERVALEALAKVAMELLENRVTQAVDRSESESALAKQQDFLNAVLENVADGIVACDAEGHLTVFNHATRVFHGLESDVTIPAEKWSEHYSLFEADGETLMPQNRIPLLRALSGENVKDAEMVVVTIKGEKRSIECNGRALFNKEGEKLGAVVTLHDTTAMKEAYAKVEKANTMLRELLSICPIAITVLDLDGTVNMWNPAAEKMFGWTADEVLGGQLPYLSEEERKTGPPLQKAVNAKRGRIETMTQRRHREGHMLDVQILVVPVIADGQNITGYLAVFLDIGDMKKRESNLIAANQALIEASVAKSEFLANMSHELLTPLNGIIGLSEVVQMAELKDEERTQVHAIEEAGVHLLAIVNDILDFSKIEAGQMSIDAANFNLKSVVEGAVRMVEPSAKAKSIGLQYQVPSEAELEFDGDAGRIQQILLNLLGNAIKFSNRGDVRTVVSVAPPLEGRTRVRVEVEDSGIGISETVLPKIFQPFMQADSSMTKRFGGTGLGLSICKRLVEMMGGEIGVETEVGKGSKFWFTLALQQRSSH